MKSPGIFIEVSPVDVTTADEGVMCLSCGGSCFLHFFHFLMQYSCWCGVYGVCLFRGLAVVDRVVAGA